MFETLRYLTFKPHILRTIPYRGGSTREPGQSIPHKLSSNESPLGPSPLALAAIRENLETLHEYRFENDGLLCAAIGKSLGIDPGQVITGNSGMELLDLICRGIVGEGDEVILCSPTFMAYESFAHLSGARVIDVPLRPDDFSLDVGAVLAAVTGRTKMVFIGNPNNPTGSLIPRETMDTLMTTLSDRVVVVYDEVYHHFVDSTNFPRALDYIREDRNLVGLHSFSKAYGLAGIRLGYAFAPPAIAEYLQHLRRPFMIGTLTTVAGMAALSDLEHIQATQKLVSEEKQWLYGELERLGVQFWKSEANFILFRPPIQVNSFVAQMGTEGVMVRNAEVMRAAGCVRVTVGTREANKAFMQGLRLAVQKF